MPSESNPPYPLPGRPFDLPKPEAPYRPAYFKNTIPSYWRRDKNHDYTRRCIYMLTMRKAPDMPDFSNVFAPDGNPFKPQISLSRLGAIIYHEIHSLSVSFPSVKVFDSVVMPDHIHFVVYLSESGMHPGDIVKKFKGLCSRAWQRLQRPLRTSATLLRPLHARPLPHNRRRDLPHLHGHRHPRAQRRPQRPRRPHRLRQCHPAQAHGMLSRLHPSAAWAAEQGLYIVFFQTFTESDGALYPRRGERVTELFVAVKYYLCG